MTKNLHISNIINTFVSEKINYNNLIMEDFVPFEIAKKLEGLGFDKSSLFFYREDDEDKCVHCVDINQPLIDAKITIAPTISQVLKWLREKEISVEPISTLYNCWDCHIKNKGELETIINNDKYKTYENAALAGIECVLDNSIDYGKNRFN